MRSTLASAAAARTFSAPAGFTASVLGAARRLPDRRELQELEVGGSIVRVCRQILIAAAVVVGLGALWHLGLFRGGHDSRLEAGPNEVQKEMERLDSLIDADEAGVTRAK